MILCFGALPAWPDVTYLIAMAGRQAGSLFTFYFQRWNSILLWNSGVLDGVYQITWSAEASDYGH